MKKIYILSCLFITCLFTACNDDWDNYYFGNGSGAEELDMTIVEFFETHPEYSSYYNLLNKVGLDKEISRNQQMTLWVANNESVAAANIEDTDTLRMEYHMNHLPFTPTDLKDGLRIKALNGIYLQITRGADKVFVNATPIEKSYKLKDGVIHIIGSLLKSRINMFDYISQLDEEYSLIRDSIMHENVKVFDKKNSIPVGVDISGNTVYDSVFYIDNPLFEKVKFNSEFEQLTLFLPSNQVINGCFKKLEDQFASMGKTVQREDSVTAWSWIKRAIFYNKVLEPSDIKEGEDISSAFGKVWRNSVQKIDMNTPVEMSNGRMYLVTDMKVPNNVMISRIKSYLKYFDKLTEDQKKQYFTRTDNVTSLAVTNDPGSKDTYGNPYEFLTAKGTLENEKDPFWIEFPPIDADGNIMEVPCGDYILYLGFRSGSHPYVNGLFDGNSDGITPSTSSTLKLIKPNLDIFNSTPWNFDRSNETEDQRIPNGVKKRDGLGGEVGKVTITSPEGNGMSSFRIRIEYSKPKELGGTNNFEIYHWALKPADTNY